MSWKTIRADEFCESVRDGTHDTPKPNETGYKLVTGKHVKNGQIDPSDAYYISEKDYKKINERSLVEQWDVLMSMIGTVGEVAVVKDHPNYAIKNVALFKCGGSELKGKWLAYYLRSSDAQGHMSGNQKGSSQQFLSLNQLRSLPIPITDERYMQRVIDILSAYDELIENNQKQIKLLEEAAQRLYKEWFVDLRFPGHETTPIVDGVPEGWKKVCLDDVISKITTGLNPRKNFVLGIGKNYYVTIKNMANNSIYLNDKCDRIDDEAIEKINSRSDLQLGDILFSGIGTIGRVYMIDIPPTNWNVSESVFTMRANNLVSKEYLYLLLLSHDMQSYCDQNAHGVAQRGIRMADLRAYKFSLPSKNVLVSFTSLAKPIIEKTQCLRQQITLLEETRDRLLPKLMSGEIEV